MASAEELERGMFVLINNNIYKINRKEVVAVGTHSHSKTKIYCQPLLGGGERTFTFAHKDKVEVPDIENRVGQVISKGDSTVTVMDNDSYETLDVKANPALLSRIEEGQEIFFFTYEGVSTALKIDERY